MPRTRHRFSPEQKAAILRAHLVDRVPISDLCDKHKIQPTQFCRWQKDMFVNLPSLFESTSDARLSALARQNAALKDKLAHTDEVIAEIMEEMIAVKKTTGER
jgi:transposase-like protein